jgi:hypothetical protein
MDIITLMILFAATWRIASLLAREEGPWAIFEKFRHRIGVRWNQESIPEGSNMISKMILCIWCNSIWVGGFWTIANLLSPLVIWLALPFALSAGAIFMEHVVGESYGNR